MTRESRGATHACANTRTVPALARLFHAHGEVEGVRIEGVSDTILESTYEEGFGSADYALWCNYIAPDFLISLTTYTSEPRFMMKEYRCT
jgi:hypothetical protein